MNSPILHFRIADPFIDCMLKAGIPESYRSRFDGDAEDNLEAHVASSAPSTLYGFRTDIVRWIGACQIVGADPFNPAARDVRDFLREFEVGRKPATVKRMVANISVLTSGVFGNRSVCQSKVVRAEMKRIRREKGAQHKQALAIRQRGDVAAITDPPAPFSIQRMLQVLEPDKSLRALRGKVLISLGGDTGRRHSEYRSANFSHVIERPDGTGTFHVNRSKTDQDGKGIVRFVSRRTIRYLKQWKAARIASGENVTPETPLLLSFPACRRPGKRLCHVGYHIALRWTVGRALTLLSADHPELCEQIPDILRRISGHSFRVGMVQDLSLAKVPLDAICREGSWETPAMVLLYGRNINAAFGATAQMLTDVGANDPTIDAEDGDEAG